MPRRTPLARSRKLAVSSPVQAFHYYDSADSAYRNDNEEPVTKSTWPWSTHHHAKCRPLSTRCQLWLVRPMGG